MSKTMYMLPDGIRPEWLVYPPAYLRIIGQNLVDLTPWHIMCVDDVKKTLLVFAKRFPDRSLFPFAWKQDSEDFACWAKDGGTRVIVINEEPAAEGEEIQDSFDDTWAWFRDAIEETSHWGGGM